MPPRPVPLHMRWQLEQQPLVITNFRRPFYICPSNNGLGAPAKPQAKAPTIEHVSSRVPRVPSSNGTVLPGTIKLNDG